MCRCCWGRLGLRRIGGVRIGRGGRGRGMGWRGMWMGVKSGGFMHSSDGIELRSDMSKGETCGTLYRQDTAASLWKICNIDHNRTLLKPWNGTRTRLCKPPHLHTTRRVQLTLYHSLSIINVPLLEAHLPLSPTLAYSQDYAKILNNGNRSTNASL